MSRSVDRNAAGQAGFALVEVLVALGVFLTAMVALLPQLVAGLRATDTAREVTQGKAIAQGRLELMRNLPFHVAPAAGDYIDVLDTYFRTLVPPTTTPSCGGGGVLSAPQPEWSGYVSASATRCSYEPAGPLYRKVVDLDGAGDDRLALVVDTQFLAGAATPTAVAPPAGYDSQNFGTAAPPTSQIGVTVTVLRKSRATRRPVTIYTQISRNDAAAARVRAEASVTAVEIGSAAPGEGQLSLSAGLVNLSGSLFHTSGVTAYLAATTAGASSGAQAAGASAAVVAPPAGTGPPGAAGEGAFPVGGCDYACWGATQRGLYTVTAADGLPRAGGRAQPLTVTVPAGATRGGFQFGNGPTDAGLGLVGPLATLDTAESLSGRGVGDCAASGAGVPAHLGASGYLDTTAEEDPDHPGTVDACVAAHTVPVSLFPTAFAPGGVVRIQLTHASARCTVSGAAHVPSTAYDYEALVQYWNGASYSTAAVVTPSLGTDALAGLPLTTSVGGGHTLGDYITSWSALTSGRVAATAAAGTAAATLPGLVTVVSAPVRADAPASTVSIAVGAVQCRVEDAR